MQPVAVLGGGSFGTAIATFIARRGIPVRMWSRDLPIVEGIRATRHNPWHLTEFELPANLVATGDVGEALEGAAWAMVTVPSHGVRDLLVAARPHLGDKPIVIGTKGLESDTLLSMGEIALDVLGPEARDRILALSGPSFAREIMLEHPTAVVLACRNEGLARRIAPLLFSDSFRAYTSADVVGVEMGGALKNVIAIASGAVTGLGYGDNTRAALITRGLAEITRIAVAKGAHPLTLAGLSGVGDLTLTCTGELSRNRAVGQALGEGKTLAQAVEAVREVAEGVRTARSAHLLAQKLGVDARITRAVYGSLYEGVPAREAFLSIVRRRPGSELEH